MGPIWKLFLKTVFYLLEQKTNFQLQKHIWQNLFLKQNDFLEQNLGFLGVFVEYSKKTWRIDQELLYCTLVHSAFMENKPIKLFFIFVFWIEFCSYKTTENCFLKFFSKANSWEPFLFLFNIPLHQWCTSCTFFQTNIMKVNCTIQEEDNSHI